MEETAKRGIKGRKLFADRLDGNCSCELKVFVENVGIEKAFFFGESKGLLESSESLKGLLNF